MRAASLLADDDVANIETGPWKAWRRAAGGGGGKCTLLPLPAQLFKDGDLLLLSLQEPSGVHLRHFVIAQSSIKRLQLHLSAQAAQAGATRISLSLEVCCTSTSSL